MQENVYQSLFENSSSIKLLIHPATGKIIDANKAACKFYGYHKSKLINMYIQDINTLSEDQIKKEIIAAKSENKNFFKFKHRLADGQIRDIEVYSGPIIIHGEQLLYSTIHDVTEQKKTEARLNKEIDFRKRLINTAQVIILILDVEGRIIEFNPYMEKLSGYRLEEVKNKDWFSTFLPEQDYDRIKSLFKEAVGDIPTRGNINPIVAKDGREIIIEWYDRTLKDTDSSTIGILAIGHDITEHQKRESDLVFSKFILDYSQKLSEVGSYSLDVVTQNLFWSKQQYRIFGYEPGEIQPDFDLVLNHVHPDDKDRIVQSNHEVFSGRKQSYDETYRIISKDGSVRTVHSISELEYDTSGKPIRTYGALQDITESKKMEEQLHQAQKMEAVGRLAGGVAHDFNNMLSVIWGNTEMALEEIDRNHPTIVKLQEISKAATRSTNLVRQLLAFARKQTVAPKTLDLNDTIETMLNMLQRLIGENIALTWLPGDGLWPVKIDPSQIDQILANLSVNARDAIETVGIFTIETRNITFDANYCKYHTGFIPGDYVMIAASDNGCGMPKETLNNVFDPFFTTKDAGQGTGLGLATIYGIVKQNKGFINVYSELNKGTTFKIYLPRYTDQTEREKNEEAYPVVCLGNETILLVEDEVSILKITSKMLEHLGYKVLLASTAEDAIHIFKSFSGQIDMILTDVVMNDMSGYELSQKLLHIHSNLKCLFMSGYPENVITNHGILYDGVNFIHKPFSKQDLGTKVREVLDLDLF